MGPHGRTSFGGAPSPLLCIFGIVFGSIFGSVVGCGVGPGPESRIAPGTDEPRGSAPTASKPTVAVVDATEPPTAPALDRAVDAASLVAIGRIEHDEQFRGQGGGIMGMFRVGIRRILKGAEESGRAHFTLQLTSHRTQPKFEHADPSKEKGDILVLLQRRRLVEGDPWYDLVSTDGPTWWAADSAEARRVVELLAERAR